MEKTKLSIIKACGLAVALPSTILGVFFLIYTLIESKYISSEVGLVIILLMILYMFYQMVRYANKK